MSPACSVMDRIHDGRDWIASQPARSWNTDPALAGRAVNSGVATCPRQPSHRRALGDSFSHVTHHDEAARTAHDADRLPALAASEAAFLLALPVIDRIVGIISRRNALAVSDADEFAAWARSRIADNEYAILRKFGGRSSLATYLSVVLGNLFRDYRNSTWGRWRPSAAAQRLGPIGIRLEELLVRDGSPLREAIGVLRSAGVAESDRDLARMATRLPHRAVEKEVALDDLGDTIEDSTRIPALSGDDRLRVERAIRGAVELLPDEDRVITRMRFWDGISVADIARILRLNQKSLYRRIENIQQRLKASMSTYGVSEQDVLDLLQEENVW
jgi:DNA-directed RNA polymerase specialized sigma24 family protein